MNMWFFKIPKAATSSIHVKLASSGKHRQTNRDDKRRQGNVVELPSGDVVHYYDHLSPQLIVDRGIATRAELEVAYTFAVVRHPCDRLASLWHNWGHRFPGDFQHALANAELVRSDYTNVPRIWPSGRWLCWPDGTPTCNLVLRYERLDADWAELAEQLGVSKELPHENKSERRHWRETLTRQEQFAAMRHEEYIVQKYGYALD